MMAELKFNFISIRWYFIFALIFHYKCDGNPINSANYSTSSAASTNYNGASTVTNVKTAMKTTTPRITTHSTTTRSSAAPITSEPNCSDLPSTPLISIFQFGALLLISVLALICVVYYLYLKTLEIKSRVCSCRMQNMSQLGNQTDELRYTLDPGTISKLLAHHNVTAIQRNESINQGSDQGISSIKAAPDTPRSDFEKEILSWNAHKYPEHLKNEDEHIYENLNSSAHQLKNLNYNRPSTSSTQDPRIQHLSSFEVNENVRISPKIFRKN